jgi:hypothetical protein
MVVDPFGVLWAVDDDLIYSTTNLAKYDGSAWTSRMATGTSGVAWYSSVAVDPTRCSSKATCHIAAVASGNEIVSLTTDGGMTWNNSGGGDNRSYVSTGGVDWLLTYYKAQPNQFFANTDSAFDPLHSGRLYTASEGVWYLNPPVRGRAITLTQQTRGIEQFIAIQIISPASAGNSVLLGTWDFPCFYSKDFDSYPSTISCAAGPNQPDLLRGYSMDWVWNSPSTIVSIVQAGNGYTPVDPSLEWSGISTRGGIAGSWKKFRHAASTANGGCIAISDTNTILWVSAASANVPQLTTDGGNTWKPIVIPGGTPVVSWGPLASGLPASRPCESDKGNGDLYLYNINDGTGKDQLYRWTKSTGEWSLRNIRTLPLLILTSR